MMREVLGMFHKGQTTTLLFRNEHCLMTNIPFLIFYRDLIYDEYIIIYLPLRNT